MFLYYCQVTEVVDGAFLDVCCLECTVFDFESAIPN